MNLVTIKDTPLNLTPAAQTHIQKILARHKNAQGMRLGVKNAGCSGKAYVISPVLETDALHEKDNVYKIENLFIYIDSESLKFLKGCHVDYQRKGLTGKLVFENPQQKAQCGCGESFYV